MTSPILAPFLAAALLLATAFPTFAQPGPANQAPPGARGARGFGPALPPDQQALVVRITSELAEQSQLVAAANSNLVAASFVVPKDLARITQANQELAKAREAWAAKASQLVARIQASETKLSDQAIARLVAATSGGRGGRGGPGPGSGGPRGEGPGRGAVDAPPRR